MHIFLDLATWKTRSFSGRQGIVVHCSISSAACSPGTHVKLRKMVRNGRTQRVRIWCDIGEGWVEGLVGHSSACKRLYLYNSGCSRGIAGVRWWDHVEKKKDEVVGMLRRDVEDILAFANLFVELTSKSTSGLLSYLEWAVLAFPQSTRGPFSGLTKSVLYLALFSFFPPHFTNHITFITNLYPCISRSFRSSKL